MKKFILLPLLFLALSACGQKELAPNTLHNDELGVVLALGMTREEVERQLETTFDTSLFIDPSAPVEPEEYERDNSVSYGIMGDQVLVFYADNVVVGIDVGDTELTDMGSHWALSGGVTSGSTEEEVLAALGETTTWSYLQVPDEETDPDGASDSTEAPTDGAYYQDVKMHDDKTRRSLHFYYNADHSRNMKATAPSYAVSVHLQNGIVAGIDLFQIGY